MKKYIEQLPQEVQELIKSASGIAAASGMKAFLVGGFVRDLILGVRNFDVDITVEGDGIAFAHDLAHRLHAKVVFHRRFGTATVTVKHHHKIDIATARKEFYPEPGSLPVVNRGALKDDLVRRDFTINTMAISINRDDFGRLIDLFGAQSDIRHRKVRILHPSSFIDDPTRILRAVRFEQRYGFAIEEKTLACLTEAVKLKMLGAVEPQRLRDELVLILKEDDPVRPILRLKELSGLDFIQPGFSLAPRAFSLMRSAGRAVSWFRTTFSSHRQIDSWLIYVMCLLDGLDERSAQAVCDRFVFRKGETKRLMAYIASRDRVTEKLSKRTLRPSTVYHLLEPLSYEVILALRVKAKSKAVAEHIELFFRHYNGTGISVRGADLHGMGLEPGPHYQKILRTVLNAKLDGRIASAQEELELARRLKKKHDHRRP